MKVILSTGQGRLHFVETAEALRFAGITPTVLTGWVPSLVPKFVVNALGPLVGRDRLYQRLSLRRRILEAGCPVKTLFGPEAYMQARYALARLKLNNRSKASAAGWEYYGKASIPHLQGDIFHVRSGAGQGGAIAAAKARGMKVIVDHSLAHPKAMQHNLKSLYEKNGIHFNLSPSDPFWRLVLADCEQADLLLVNSDYVKETFVAEGYPAEKIAVAYLGVRGDFIGLKQDYTIPEGRPIRLLFTGGFALRKGADVMIQAMRQLDHAGVEARLIVAGHSVLGETLLESTCPELKHKFDFRGFLPQDELKSLFREADVYLFPSYAEGCAKSAMEAAAAGMPIICTEETGLPQAIAAGISYIPRGDPFSIAVAIRDLISNAERRQSMGEFNKTFITYHLSWTTYGQNLFSLYESLLAS